MNKMLIATTLLLASCALLASTEAQAQDAKTYTVEVDVTVDASKPDGKHWDAGGGAPDVVVTARSSRDGRVLKGEKHEDRLTFTETLGKYDLAEGDTITFTLIEKDLASDDPVGSVTVDFKTGTQEVRAGAARLKVTLK